MTLCCAFDNKGLAFCTHREDYSVVIAWPLNYTRQQQPLSVVTKRRKCTNPSDIGLREGLTYLFSFGVSGSDPPPSSPNSSYTSLSPPLPPFYPFPFPTPTTTICHGSSLRTKISSAVVQYTHSREAGEGGPMHFCTGACIDLRWNNPPKRPLRTPKTPHANENPCSFPLYFPFCYK